MPHLLEKQSHIHEFEAFRRVKAKRLLLKDGGEQKASLTPKVFKPFLCKFNWRYSNRLPVSVAQPVAIKTPLVLKISDVAVAVKLSLKRSLINWFNPMCRRIICFPAYVPSALKRKN